MDKHEEPHFVCSKYKSSDKSGLILRENGVSGKYLISSTTTRIRNSEKQNKPSQRPHIGISRWKAENLTYKIAFDRLGLAFLKDVFLPRGFPDSVHPDYAQYQIWDTVQASASTILGTLTTHSIMRGVGVGESSATPLAAAITWILKDGTGMVGRIVFAWWNGPELDAQCKKWRLFADVLNDLAMGIELTLPYVPSFSTILLCFSSGMKSLVGVAGGATRASITQHQALRNNLADVSAKDGSQETCVNLIASLIGVFMLSYLDASSHVLFWYIALVGIHIYANFRAVRALCFDTLNEDRLAIIVKHYLTRSTILSPKDANERESLLVFHRATRDLCGFDISIGESLEKNVDLAKSRDPKSSEILEAFKSFRSVSILSLNPIFTDVEKRFVEIAPFHEATSEDFLKSYCLAFLISSFLSILHDLRPDIKREAERSEGPLSNLYRMAQETRASGSRPKAMNTWMIAQTCALLRQLKDSGWTTETNLLPIGPYRFYQGTTSLKN